MTAPTPTDDAVFGQAAPADPAPAAAPAAPAPVAEPPVAPATVEPTAEVAVAEPAAPAVPDGPEPWKHETIEFEGDVLEVRKPTEHALAAFSLASSKYVSPEMKNDITGLFISRHLSDESYGHVFSRFMDPDDTAYTITTIGDLMRAIVDLAVAEMNAKSENTEQPAAS